MKGIPRWIQYTVGLIPVAAFFWGVYIYFFPVPQLLGSPAAVALSAGIIAHRTNIADILKEYEAQPTSLAKQSFLEPYAFSGIYGTGSFADIAKSGQGYLVTIRDSGEVITCNFGFDPEIVRALLLLKKAQEISYTGTFTAEVEFGGGWAVNDCVLVGQSK